MPRRAATFIPLLAIRKLRKSIFTYARKGLAVEKVNISAVKNGDLGEMTSKLTTEESEQVGKMTKKDKTIVWLTMLGSTLVIGGLLMLNRWLVKKTEFVKLSRLESLAAFESRFRVVKPA